ncbi:hypothetical protein [Pseudonocardia sp. TMWB2A]|uniref:hypothetical protein n=1 Tax=Pseudonocardia sp. TMWB2A TaxID=687430 RepID=UPI00307CEFA9
MISPIGSDSWWALNASSTCTRVSPVPPMVDAPGDAISWDDYSENLVAVDVGDHSFTLHRHPDQAEYLRDIVDAAVAGRIVELHGLGRTRLVIPRRDGTTVHETGHRFPLGLVPLPGWPKRASSTTFAPYPPVQDPTRTIEG